MDANGLQEARDTAADKYQDPFTKHACRAGWDAAMAHVGLLVQTPGGDGCYCSHHPDDPAHTKDCYDLVKALTGR